MVFIRFSKKIPIGIIVGKGLTRKKFYGSAGLTVFLDFPFSYLTVFPKVHYFISNRPLKLYNKEKY